MSTLPVLGTQISPGQLVSNQVLGTVIAALFRTQARRRVQLAKTGTYIPNIREYAGIPITAITQEAYQFQSDVTQHAVESGAIFSDHVILRPIRLDIEFEVSNFDGVGNNAQLAKTALDQAVAVWQSRQFFDIMTTHRYLENMVCLNLQPQNEAPEWGKLHFRATFQQVKLVTLQTVKFDASQVQGAFGVNATQQGGDATSGLPMLPSHTSPGGPPTGLSSTPVVPRGQIPLLSSHTPFTKSGASGGW